MSYLIESVLWFTERFPAVATLVILMVIDFIAGVTIAVLAKQLNSSASFRGVSKKVVMLLLVGVAACIEPYTATTSAPNGIPLRGFVCLWFIIVEAMSILENSALLGVPLPPVLVDTLVKMRDTTKNTEWQKRYNPPVVNVENVIRTHKSVHIEGPTGSEVRVVSNDPNASQQPSSNKATSQIIKIP